MEDEDGKPISWTIVSKYSRKEVPALERETIEKLREVRTQSVPLGPSFQLPLPYELVDAREIEAVFENKGWWTDYYKKWPGSQGYLVLSRIGFSADGDQALFYASNSCGGKCGGGTYVVMQKSDTGWKLVKEILVWKPGDRPRYIREHLLKDSGVSDFCWEPTGPWILEARAEPRRGARWVF